VVDRNDFNPYAAPPAGVAAGDVSVDAGIPSAPGYKLFSVGAIVLATFLGSPVAGTVLMAMNYWRLGRKSAAWISVAVGILATAFIIAAALALPEETPNSPFIVAQLLGMYFVARGLQGGLISQHCRTYGRLASMWAAAGISLLVVVPLGLVLVAALLLWDYQGLGTRYEVSDKEEIYYSGQCDADDALRLARRLGEEDFFDGSTESTVLISLLDGRYTISFAVPDGAWDETLVVTYYRALGEVLADEFGRPLDIEFLDEWLEVQKTITIR
jgi:hypothetical protein